MKKIIALLFLNLYSILCFSQTKDTVCRCIKENVFYTEITNGIGQRVPISFTISEEAMKKMKTGSYVLDSAKLNSTTRHLWDAKSGKYVLDSSEISSDSAFVRKLTYALDVQISSCVGDIRIFKIKNSTSFNIPPNARGDIYIAEFGDGGLTISFPFLAQNGYGAMIFHEYYKDENGTSIH